MAYMVATGHDVALGSLTTITPQPAVPAAVQTARRSVALSRATVDDGQFIEFVWSALQSATQYQSILTAFGLSAAVYADVTIYARDETFAWVRYNGVAHRPQPGVGVEWRRGFPVGVRLLVTGLELAA